MQSPVMQNSETILALCAVGAFALFALLSRSTDALGALAGVFGASISFWRFGPAGAGLYLLFPIAGFAITQIGRSRKTALAGSRHEVRSWQHALANTGAALIVAVLPKMLLSPAAHQALFVAALAAALSDTASSEIGLLARSKPRLITSWREVEPGEDGGVTLLGSTAGLLFGACLPILALSAGLIAEWWVVLLVTCAAMGGNLVDSLLGSALERRGMLDNHAVNFAGTGSAVVITAVILALQGRLI